MFRARDLGYTYPSGRTGLRSISLEATAGERVVVMGPNGSGKSTLLRAVSTALPVGADSLVWFADQPGQAKAARRRLGVMQDETVHVEPLTGLENARLFADLYRIPPATAQPSIEALFTAFRLDEVRDVPVAEYSFGMRRKLLLVQALAHNPELLVLDEPALGLDPPSLATLISILKERSRSGVCALIATNDPSLAASLATRVVFLASGEVIAQGSPTELLESLDGSTRIEVYLTGHTPSILTLDGVNVTVLSDRVVAESRSGVDVLPRLTEAVLSAGCRITRVDIREPNLADVFTHLTGLDMGSDDAKRGAP